MRGFSSPNFPELASVAHDRIMPNAGLIKNLDIIEFNPDMPEYAEMRDFNVFVCDIYPDLDIKLFQKICNHPEIKALIIRTYGTGGIPNKNGQFMRALKEMVSRNVIVLNLTQCPIGSVEIRLFETNAELFDMGVINGGDMVTEAAYCKLKYLFAKFYDEKNIEATVSRIKSEMIVNMQGELSDSTFISEFYPNARDKNDNNVLKNKPKNIEIKDGWKFKDGRVAADRIYNITLRLEDIQLENQSEINRGLDINFYTSGNPSKFIGAYKGDYKNSINIDITNTSREFIPSLNKLVIRSQQHSFSFKIVRIVVTVRDN